VTALVEAGVDLEARNDDGRTALHDAIELGRIEIENYLIESGAPVDLCCAAILGKLDLVRELLDRNPGSVNDDSTHISPLAWAAFGNQARVAEELIHRGARIDDGELLCAASAGHVEVGRVLLAAGVDPDALDPRAGGNALHVAAGMRYTADSSNFVALLLEAGADATIRSTGGKTALEIAEEGLEHQEEELEHGVDECELKNYAAVIEVLRRGPPPRTDG
jgi:ankyrin repeat protein